MNWQYSNIRSLDGKSSIFPLMEFQWMREINVEPGESQETDDITHLLVRLSRLNQYPHWALHSPAPPSQLSR